MTMRLLELIALLSSLPVQVDDPLAEKPGCGHTAPAMFTGCPLSRHDVEKKLARTARSKALVTIRDVAAHLPRSCLHHNPVDAPIVAFSMWLVRPCREVMPAAP